MNAIAWAALILWPVAAIVFYRKLSLPAALCATLVGGYLLLPVDVGLDLPVLPALNKSTIPALCALVLTIIAVRRPGNTYPVLPGWLPRDPVTLVLLAILVLGIFGTVYTNGDTLVYGERVIYGLKLYDAFSILLTIGMLLVPLFLARKVLASHEGQRVLLLTVALSAVLYSLLALYEVRMSPQLHARFYGFFQHSFAQHVRGDGFRPLVFLKHGLVLSIFLAYAVIAAAALFRTEKKETRWKWGFAMVWLFVTLVLSKSLGALLIVSILLPIALFAKPRVQLLVAACIAGIVMLYPILRAAQLVPVNQIMSFAESVSVERAASFNTRIVNEEDLLAKARERPAFGWAGWGRQRVYDENGRTASITDGSWIIEIGRGGWFRYIALFGLLCWPVIGLFIAKRDRIDPVCAALGLILCAKLADMIPNGGAQVIPWMVAGSLLGRLEMKLAATSKSPRRHFAYSRAAIGDTGDPEHAISHARKGPEPDEETAASAAGTPERKSPEKLTYARAGHTVRHRR